MRASAHRSPRPSRAWSIAGHVAVGAAVVGVLLLAMGYAYLASSPIG